MLLWVLTLRTFRHHILGLSEEATFALVPQLVLGNHITPPIIEMVRSVVPKISVNILK